jgi:MtN3 and saliva related transmembrane protein
MRRLYSSSLPNGARTVCAKITAVPAKSVSFATRNVMFVHRFKLLPLAVFLPSLIVLSGCEVLVPRDTKSLLVPSLQRSEVVGVVAGFGTTFAAMPDLVAMLRRRSSAGMNPRMAAIMGVFQVLWVYYGLLILSRPVVLWNIIAVLVNSLSVGAYLFFARAEKRRQAKI